MASTEIPTPPPRATGDTTITVMTAGSAQTRIEIVSNYLEMLLRNVDENITSSGITMVDHPVDTRCIDDALRSLYLAQELVQELNGLSEALSGG